MKHASCVATRKLARLLTKTSQRALAKAVRVKQPSICAYASNRYRPSDKTKKRFVKLGITLPNWEQP